MLQLPISNPQMLLPSRNQQLGLILLLAILVLYVLARA